MLEDLTAICLNTIQSGQGVELTFDDLKDYVISQTKSELGFTDDQAEVAGQRFVDFWQWPPARITHAQLAGMMAADIIQKLGL